MKDKEEVKEPLPPPPPLLSSKEKDKKEGFVESKGAVAVKDGGIGGMDGFVESKGAEPTEPACLSSHPALPTQPASSQ